jgi:hypothetical protein
MSTAEYFANSVLLEGAGVHAITWEEKEDLVRALIIILAVFSDVKMSPLLLKSLSRSEKDLRSIFEIRAISENEFDSAEDKAASKRDEVLLLFLDQAVSNSIGPLLNGWRSALAESPGTIMVIRTADFIGLQRYAPDLASFIGPKLFDASTMLSLWSTKTSERIKPQLPDDVSRILNKLPGEYPSKKGITEWIRAHPPTS